MKKISQQPTARHLLKVGQELLTFAESVHWSEPPGEERDGHRTIPLKEFTRRMVDLQRRKQATIGKDVDRIRIIDALKRNDVEPFFQGLRYDPTLLTVSPIYRMTIGTWWHQKHLNHAVGQRARKLLRKIGSVLADIAGRPEMSPEEREAIIASCKTWRPICEELNRAFKRLWKEQEYQGSVLYRKEARGRLAEKLGIPVADVQTIEAFLSNPSQTAWKRTPHDAMLHRVAREFPGVGKKTVETIWGNYLKDHPDQRRRRRSAA